MTATVIIVKHITPLWAVVIVLARDGLLLLMLPFLNARKIERPPVSTTGKAGSFGVMWAFGLFIGAASTNPPTDWVRTIAWLAYYPGVALSYIAAADYARTVFASLRART